MSNKNREADMRVKTFLKKSTPSKNLMNLDNYRLETTSSAHRAIAININHLIAGEKYTFSTNAPNIKFFKIGTEWGSINYFIHAPSTAFNTLTFAMPSVPTKPYLYVGTSYLGIPRIDDFKPYFWQIEQGSTATEYEPYGDYQRVKVWNGKQSKNLFNLRNESNQYRVDNTQFEKLSESSFKMYSTGDFGNYNFRVQVQVGKTYTVAAFCDKSYGRVYFSRKKSVVDNYGMLMNALSNTWEVGRFTADTGELHIAFYGRINELTEFKCMLLEGSYTRDNLHDFEPYNQPLMKVNIKE